MYTTRQQIKRDFYKDFLDIYWGDEYENGCSDTTPCQEDDRDYIKSRYGDLRLEVCPVIITKRISIETYKDIKDFVALASKYGDNLIIKSKNYSFPACSLMSVMSLVDLSDTVKIQFDDNEVYEDDIMFDFGKWIVNE